MKFSRPKIYWEPRDLWVGLYWTKGYSWSGLRKRWVAVHFYLCLVPCLPLQFTVWFK